MKLALPAHRAPAGQPGRQAAPEAHGIRFPAELADVPLLLPGRDNDIRAGFDLMCEQLGMRYRLRAKVDDIALLRRLARDSDSVARVPTVLVRDELRSGLPVEYAVVPDLHESFFAISANRRFEPPRLKALLRQSEALVLAPVLG